MRQYVQCDCPRDPERQLPIHPRHFKGGANLVPGARKWHLLVAELGGAAAVIHGIGIWSVPSAFIVAGLAVIVAVEMRT